MLNFKKIRGNLIHRTAIINWSRVIIGKGNLIGPYSVIGNNAQYPDKKSNGKIVIGNKNVFNEYCNIHLPTQLTKKTFIGNNNYLMNSTTVDHDCYIEDKVVLSSNVVLGGNVYIMQGAQLGIKVSIHQNQVIGSYTMIGMHSFVTKKNKIKPGFVFFGKPVKKIKKNLIGLKRSKISSTKIKLEQKRFDELILKRS